MTYNVFSGTLNPTHFTSQVNIVRGSCVDWHFFPSLLRTWVNWWLLALDSQHCQLTVAGCSNVCCTGEYPAYTQPQHLHSSLITVKKQPASAGLHGERPLSRSVCLSVCVCVYRRRAREVLLLNIFNSFLTGIVSRCTYWTINWLCRLDMTDVEYVDLYLLPLGLHY